MYKCCSNKCTCVVHVYMVLGHVQSYTLTVTSHPSPIIRLHNCCYTVMLVMVAPRHTPGLIKNYKSCKNLCTRQKIIESTFKYPLFLKNECLPIVDMGSIQETIKFNIKHIPTTVDNVSFLYNKFCSHTSVML